MNKDDIKKALVCCSNPSINSCKDCPYANNGKFSCRDGEMFKDTLDLITKQEQEIELLEAEIERLETVINDLQDLMADLQSLANRIDDRLYDFDRLLREERGEE